MAKIRHPYTEDEIYNNYEFKLIRRALINEFPWIKDVKIEKKYLNQFNNIYLSIDFDPAMLGEQMGWELTPWVKRAVDSGDNYDAMFLSLPYIDVSPDDTKVITDKIDDIIESIRRSPAIPSELKLKGDRPIIRGEYVLNRDSSPLW